MRLRLSLVLATLLPLSAAANPWAESIRCVQNQLNAAGLDAGPEDGLIGPRTRAALDEFAAREWQSRANPLFHETAAATCRRIGESQADLRAFWPSHAIALETFADPQVHPVLVTMIASAFRTGRDFAAHRMGIEAAATDVLLIGASPQALAALMRTHGGIAVDDDRFAAACGTQWPMAAASFPNMTAFCVHPDLRPGRVRVAEIQALAAHEATHLVQFQASGGLPKGAGARDYLARRGPVWLSEGSAELLAHLKTGSGTMTQMQTRRMLLIGGTAPDLRTLELRDAATPPFVYGAGSVAAADLLADRSPGDFGRFYTLLGAGEDWQAAFETAFGQTPEAFYRAYDARWRGR